MEVKMNKEIRDYQESMFFGLNLRQCIFSVLAVITAVGIYFQVRGIFGDEIIGWLCMLGAAPFAACGFFSYHGMAAEQFLWAFLKSEILFPKRLVYRNENLYYKCLEETIRMGERAGKNSVAAKQEERNDTDKKEPVKMLNRESKKKLRKTGRGDAID